MGRSKRVVLIREAPRRAQEGNCMKYNKGWTKEQCRMIERLAVMSSAIMSVLAVVVYVC